MRRFFSATDIRVYPLYYVEMILGLFIIVGGSLILFPAFVVANKPEHSLQVFAVIGSDIAIVILGVLAIISGLLTMTGLIRNKMKLRTSGMFLQFILRLYATIGVLLVYGLYPTTWISTLTLTLVSAVVWLSLKGNEPYGP